MTDVVRHQRNTSRGRAVARAIWIRITGLALYGAVVVWCAYALQESLPFVVLGAALGGGVLHAWKGRPWLGLSVFVIIVVIVPLLLLPALGIGTYADLSNRL